METNMAYALNGSVVEEQTLNQLHSKVIFDRVEIQTKKRPESSTNSGNHKLDSAHEPGKMGSDKSILSQSPNSYKDNGVPVENLGYFIIPRSIANDPRYQAARLKYQKVLFTILKHAAFAPTTHAIGVEVIPIAIGQFCVAERKLVELCNEGVKFKEDLVDRNVVTRAVQFFSKCQYLIQQVIHGKTLITVTIPEFYKIEKPQSEPASEPKVSQNRATKEEDKELKEDNISSKKEGTFVPSEFATSLLTEFYSSLFLSIPDFPKDSARKTKAQYQAAESIGKKAKYDMDLIRKVIAFALMDGGFWQPIIHSVKKLNEKFPTLVGQMRNQGLKPMNGKKPQPKYNHDTSPSHPSKSISFAEEV
jgi:hypothetical protein